jgi:hypothetical protein
MKNFLQFLLISIIAFPFSSCKKENPVVSKPPIVNAGSSQTIQLPVSSVSLTGSVDSGKNKIVGYLWSEVSGPNVPVIMSESSSVTVVKGLIVGDYIFQFMAIDENGLSGIDTVWVTVTPSPIMTLNLQPDNNPTEVHIWGNSSGLDQSTPTSHELGAAEWTYNGQNIGIRAAFKFDLSSMPSNAVIISAKLSLYSNPNALNGDHVNPNYGTDNSMFIQKITTSWDAATVNWIHQPATSNTNQISIPATTLPTLDLIDIDVTKLVNDMVTNNSNYGFMIRLQNEILYNSRIFCSSKYPDATKHPKLVVVYQLK